MVKMCAIFEDSALFADRSKRIHPINKKLQEVKKGIKLFEESKNLRKGIWACGDS
jgi:hypothetical protein